MIIVMTMSRSDNDDDDDDNGHSDRVDERLLLTLTTILSSEAHIAYTSPSCSIDSRGISVQLSYLICSSRLSAPTTAIDGHDCAYDEDSYYMTMNVMHSLFIDSIVLTTYNHTLHH